MDRNSCCRATRYGSVTWWVGRGKIKVINTMSSWLVESMSTCSTLCLGSLNNHANKIQRRSRWSLSSLFSWVCFNLLSVLCLVLCDREQRDITGDKPPDLLGFCSSHVNGALFIFAGATPTEYSNEVRKKSGPCYAQSVILFERFIFSWKINTCHSSEEPEGCFTTQPSWHMENIPDTQDLS